MGRAKDSELQGSIPCKRFRKMIWGKYGDEALGLSTLPHAYQSQNPVSAAELFIVFNFDN